MMNDKVNVMIVDDRRENLMVLESILEQLDVNIIKASSGNEALGHLLHYEFAVVLLDVQMPDMNGFELAEIMRSREITAGIPIIFVTAISREQKYVFKGYDLGAVDYLFKPILETKIITSKVKVFVDIFLQKQKIREQALQLEKKVNELEKTKLQLEMANIYLEELSYFDNLTGIANRHSLENYIFNIINKSIGGDSQLSVMMLDIDYFKGYNDNYGHVEGDKCLRQVAQCIKAALKRPIDFVARYGGEEFVVILPNMHGIGAVKVAQDIKKAVEDLRIEHKLSEVSEYVTISIGVAHLTVSKVDNIHNMVEKADVALYEAKNSGRNSISIYRGYT